jgi:hypothetical protein
MNFLSFSKNGQLYEFRWDTPTTENMKSVVASVFHQCAGNLTEDEVSHVLEALYKVVELKQNPARIFLSLDKPLTS